MQILFYFYNFYSFQTIFHKIKKTINALFYNLMKYLRISTILTIV